MLLKAFLIVIMLGVYTPALAQEDDFQQRLELAQTMVDLRPAEGQLESAVDLYIRNYMVTQSDREQDIFREAMLKVMNPKALEKFTVDAYAEIFTLDELEAMAEYFSKPEARSASDKQGQLNARIGPQIVKMLDQALVYMRTQEDTP